MNIYVDMDDVLADFKQYSTKILGKQFNEVRYENLTWAKLKENPRLYRDLEVKDGAYKLMEFLSSYKNSYSIYLLTAVPRNNDMQWAFYDKVNWAQKYFPDYPVFFGPFSTDKWRHLRTSNDVLIDDRESNYNDWKNAGGKAYLYKNVDECILWAKDNL